MNSNKNWTLKIIKNKIENLEDRMVKMDRKEASNMIANEVAQRKPHHSGSKFSVSSVSPIKKHQQKYLSIARKFITFSNSILIQYIQCGLRQEAYDLLKK